MKILIREDQQIPRKINSKGSIPRHIKVKIWKATYKEKIIKVAREEPVMCKGSSVRETAD